MENQENNKKKKRVLLIVIIIAAIAVAAVVLVVVKPGKSDRAAIQASSNKKELKLDSDQGEYQDMTEKGESPRNIVMPGWSGFTFPAETTDIVGRVDFYNPDENEGYYYMSFELLVDTDGSGEYKSLYQSDLVEPGNHIQKIKISEPLKAGVYKAKVFIQPYSIADLDRPLNTGTVEITLNVE